jgi:hypothetical protein
MDWSSFWPDMIVAVFTGVFVGLTVLVVERRLSTRAAERESARAQAQAVSRATRWMRASVTYVPRSLVPDDTDMQRVRATIEDAAIPDSEAVSPQFDVLREYVSAWDAMVVSARKVEARINAKAINPKHMFDSLNRVISLYGSMSVAPDPPSTPIWHALWADFNGRVASDRELDDLMGVYVRDRVRMETFRRAYIAWVDAQGGAFIGLNPDAFVSRRAARRNRLARRKVAEAALVEVTASAERNERRCLAALFGPPGLAFVGSDTSNPHSD